MLETRKLRVILSSNVPRYKHAAQALHSQKILQMYIFALGITNQEPSFAKLLPYYWRKKLQGKYMENLSGASTKSLWISEILQKSLPRTKVISRAKANSFSNSLFDILARRSVSHCDVFHFSAGVGLRSTIRAKRQGATVICDVRTEHPQHQFELLREEMLQLGVKWEIPESRDYERIEEELRLADFIIVPSEYARSTFLARGFDPGAVFAVPPGVDVRYFNAEGTREFDRSKDKFRIIYSGQIIPRKGLKYLVDAYDELNIPRSELLLLGRIDDSMHDWLESRIRRNPTIVAVGSIPQIELRKYYETGSVFVLPSISDSWGLVTLEAMACGLPVIVSKNCGSKSVVKPGINGFVVPIRDVGALHQRIMHIYLDPAMRARMSVEAALTATKYSWKAYQENLLRVYGSIARTISA